MKKINLPDNISDSIYKRMRAEREESVARKHRSQGREERAEVIRAQAELNLLQYLLKLTVLLRVTRGDADAEAAKIYSDAYNKITDSFGFLCVHCKLMSHHLAIRVTF